MIFAGGFSDFEKFQKAEQKEKEKRHRERLKSIEIQRDKLHRAACEEAAAKFIEFAADPPLKTKHRHSLHSSTNNHLNITTEQFEKLKIHGHEKGSSGRHDKNGPQRSTSSDQCRLPDKKNSISSSGSGNNKFLKWLGLASKDTDAEKQEFKEMKKRRMSTFT